jgi:hypothetical protein
MDFGAPPKSPFGPPDPALQIVDLEDPPDFDPAAPVSPEEFAAALRVSVQAFHALALAHKQFLATTTEERLNKHGIPKTFAINDRVKIYVPPTHAQILRTGRESNHIVAWRGPCTITRILSPSAYEMTEDCSGRTFQRTIINIRPFRATKTPPPPHHDLVSSAALLPSTIIAVRDTPDSAFHLAKVLHLTEPYCPSTTLAPPLAPWTPLSSVLSGLLSMAAPCSRTPALPATTPPSLAKSTLPTFRTSWLPPTFSSPRLVAYHASLLAFYSTSATNSTSINLLHPFHSPRVEPVALPLSSPVSSSYTTDSSIPSLGVEPFLYFFFSLHEPHRSEPNQSEPNRSEPIRSEPNRSESN